MSMVVDPAQALAEAAREMWAERVANRRLDLGWTQEQLALAAEVAQGTITKIENAKMWPSDVMKVRIAWALGCKPETVWNWDRV